MFLKRSRNRYQWKNYKNNEGIYQELCTSVQQHFYEHFSKQGHRCFLGYVSITLIEKTDRLNLFIERKDREVL